MSHVSFLRQVPLFESLDDAEIDALSELTFTRTFNKETVIILAEEEGDTLFIIKDGQVKVSIVSEEGREVILSLLGGGAVFGELSLLDGKPRSANVVATEDTELLMLRRTDFIQLIYKTPQIEGLALLDVTSRISETLLQLASEQGSESEEGVIIRHRPTHQELANMSGTTRETVSRVLKRLESQGYIISKGRQLIILREESWAK